MADDLVAFLRARYAEEDEVIRKNRGDHGLRDGGFYPDYKTYWGEPDMEAADEYLQAFAPPRMAAEVHAKRRILDEVHSVWPSWFGPRPADVERSCAGCGANNDEEPATPDINDCPTLRLLALPYADHPDYREAWRP